MVHAKGVDTMDVDTNDREETSEDDIYERGSDETINVICIPPPDLDWSKVDQY